MNQKRLTTYKQTFHKVKTDMLALKWCIDLHVIGHNPTKKKFDRLAKLLFDIERDINDIKE